MAFSLQEKIAEIEVAAANGAWRQPDSIIIDRPDWFQLTTPSSKHYALNGVARSILRSEDAPRIVAETLASYRAAGQGHHWIVGPRSAPADLGTILEANELKLSYTAQGMVADVERLEVSRNSAVSVTQVGDEDVRDYVTACVEGSDGAEETGQGVFKVMTLAFEDRKHPIIYYLARVDGEPAGTGALQVFARSGHLLASRVVPKFRGRGVYRALVAERLAVLRSQGIPLVTIQAISDTSAPICKKLGFETVCEMRAYISGAG